MPSECNFFLSISPPLPTHFQQKNRQNKSEVASRSEQPSNHRTLILPLKYHKQANKGEVADWRSE
ncbi:MAG: hypothetical protein WBA71_07750, partial [Candidatus Humimicrobiia bacterium]